MKKQTTNLDRAKNWIFTALKTGENKYFRFVNISVYGHMIYTDWITPENAKDEVLKRNNYNTLRIEMITL